MELFIGARLKKIRESQGISLETISHKTRISLNYLKAIEINDEDSLPSKVQLRGFIRLYASFLGVNIDDLSVDDYHLALSEQPVESSVSPDDAAQHASVESIPTGNSKLKPTLDSIPEDKPQIEAEIDFQENLNEFSSLEPIFYEEIQNSSRSLFVKIGEELKQQRELLSISIKDVFEIIHIREEYISSIELGNFDQLPSPVQGKGMLINYANFLNLDVETLLSKYTDALQLQHLEKQKEIQNQSRKPAKELSRRALKLKTFFSLDLLIISSLFLVFAAFVVWGSNRILKGRTIKDVENDNIPGVSDVLLAPPTHTPRLQLTVEVIDENNKEDEVTGDEEDEIAPLFTPAANDDPINLILIPRQRLWVKVTSDEEVVFQGRLIPGNAYDFYGQNSVDILTGNAGSLQIIFNDKDIGSAGLVGQVAQLTFTEFGLAQPSLINTPILLETPTTTPTPGEMDD